MITGIVAVPERKAHVKELDDLIRPSVDSLRVFWDYRHQGHWFNYSRCLATLLAEARDGEPVLVATDDVTTVPDWRERWERIHAEAKNDIYTLFSRQRHVFTPENVARGFVTRCQPKGFYDPAVILIGQRDLLTRVSSWFHDEGGKDAPSVKRRSSHFDVVLQEYLISQGKAWTIATPSLFDHKSIKSTMGHTVGGSPCYVGSLPM